MGIEIILYKLGALTKRESVVRYFKNTSWLFLDKILKIISGLFIGVWLARYLGPEQFGTYNYVQSFFGLVAAFASLGLDRIIVKALVDKEFERSTVLGTAFLLRFAAASVVFFLLLISPYFTNNTSTENHFIIVLAACSLFGTIYVVDFHFQSLVLSRFSVIASIIVLSISSVLKITMIITGQPLSYFVYLLLYDAIAMAILLTVFYIQHSGSLFKWNFNYELMLSMLKQGWPLLLTNALVLFQMKIDQVMLRNMLNVEAVGQYAAAVKISEASYFLPMIIVSSLWPAIITSKQLGEKIYLARIQKLYDLMSVMALSIALVLSVSAEFLVVFLFGDSYKEAIIILQIHVWAAVFTYLGIVSGAYLVNEKMTRKNFYRALLGLLTNITLNYILIPMYGGQGAAIATFGSFMVTYYLYDALDRDMRRHFFMKSKSFFPVHFLRKEWGKADK